jgi:hypothetical protein
LGIDVKLVAAVSVALAALCFPCVGQVQPNELQEQCRKKTEELFYRTFKRDIRYASFESHYSLRYNKCLYLLRLENKPRGPTSMWLGVLDEKILYFGAYVEHRMAPY